MVSPPLLDIQKKFVPARVSLLGCGWLGVPLAPKLISAGYSVKGSTTRPEKFEMLTDLGVDPYLLECSPHLSGPRVNDFFQSDILVLTLPFKRKLPKPIFYQQQIESVSDRAARSGISWIIFTSSTAVYPKTNQFFSEHDGFIPENERAQILLSIENFLLNSASFQSTVLRLGGLYGGDRHLGKFWKDKDALAQGNCPVNLLHRDDAVEIICEVIRQDLRGEIFNVCSDEHPTKKKLYAKAAKNLGELPPEFLEEKDPRFKIIKNDYLKSKLKYHFKHPSPLADVGCY